MDALVQQQQAQQEEQQQATEQEAFDVMMQRRNDVIEAARDLVKVADAEDVMFEVCEDDLSDGHLMTVIRDRIDDVDTAISEMHKAESDWCDVEEGVVPKTDGELLIARLEADAALIAACAALPDSVVSANDPRFVKRETLADFTFTVSESRQEVAALRHVANTPAVYAVISAALDFLAADYAVFEAAMKKLGPGSPGPARWINYARHSGVRILDAVASASTITARVPNAHAEAALRRAHVTAQDEEDAKAKAEVAV